MIHSRGLSILFGLALCSLGAQGNSIPTVAITVAASPIPDSGSTIILLGLALVGLAIIARKFSRSIRKK